MEENIPFQDVMKGILESKEFSKLEDFQDELRWQKFSEDDRKMLAGVFLACAEHELLKPIDTDSLRLVKKSFDTALKLNPASFEIWYRKACAFARYESSEILSEALVAFEKASHLDNTSFEVWHSWANTLLRLGIQTQSLDALEFAKEKFDKAFDCFCSFDERKKEQVEPAFLWHRGLCYFMIAKHSGEACDTNDALLCYRRVEQLGFTRKEFYNDYGNALVEFAVLLNRQDVIFEAIEKYKISLEVEENEDSLPRVLSVRYFNLACCYQYLFEMYSMEEYFKKANDAFCESAKRNDMFYLTWFNWGQLLLTYARIWQNPSVLEESVEKLSKAHCIAQDNPIVVAKYAEGLALLGAHREDLEDIKMALCLIENEFAKNQNVSELYASQAICYYELARYFQEESYYKIANQKAEHGLSLNQNFGPLWYILALINFSWAENCSDLVLFEESNTCFYQASRSEMRKYSYFWNDWGVTLLQIAEITEEQQIAKDALEKFEHALLLSDNIGITWLLNYGCALDMMGDLEDDESFYEKAIQIFAYAVQQEPNLQATRHQLALAYMHMGELSCDPEYFHQAIEQIQTILQRDPEDEFLWCDLGICHLNLAESTSDDMQQEHFLLAERFLLQSQSLGNVWASYQLSCLYTLQKKYTEAIRFFEKAFQENALPDACDILEDDWLKGINAHPKFQSIIQLLQDLDDECFQDEF